jgi:hypothetical protein
MGASVIRKRPGGRVKSRLVSYASSIMLMYKATGK